MSTNNLRDGTQRVDEQLWANTGPTNSISPNLDGVKTTPALTARKTQANESLDLTDEINVTHPDKSRPK